MTDDTLAMGERLEAVAVKFAEKITGSDTPAWKLPFEVAKRLRGVPGADAAFDADPGVILPAVNAFCAILHAHPSDARDRDFSPASAETFFVEVVDRWPEVLHPGNNALETALYHADRQPIRLRPPLDRFGNTFRRILSTAWWLQKHRGDRPIYLPTHPLGRLLVVHHTGVASHLRVATRHEVLLAIGEAVYRPFRDPVSKEGPERKARTYRFNLASPLYAPPLPDVESEPAPLTVEDVLVVFPGARVIRPQDIPPGRICDRCDGTTWDLRGGRAVCRACVAETVA